VIDRAETQARKNMEIKYIEIQPKYGSHYVVVDGKEVSRHNSAEMAFAARQFWIAEEVARRESAQRAQGRETGR